MIDAIDAILFEPVGALADFPGGMATGPTVQHRELDVFERSRAREEVEALKNETEFLVSDVGELVLVQLRNINAVEMVGAFGGSVEAAEQIHQGRLPGSTGAHQGDKLPLVDVQRDSAHGMNGHFPGFIDLVDVLDLDNGSHHGREREVRDSADPVLSGRRDCCRQSCCCGRHFGRDCSYRLAVRPGRALHPAS